MTFPRKASTRTRQRMDTSVTGLGCKTGSAERWGQPPLSSSTLGGAESWLRNLEICRFQKGQP